VRLEGGEKASVHAKAPIALDALGIGWFLGGREGGGYLGLRHFVRWRFLDGRAACLRCALDRLILLFGLGLRLIGHFLDFSVKGLPSVAEFRVQPFLEFKDFLENDIRERQIGIESGQLPPHRFIEA